MKFDFLATVDPLQKQGHFITPGVGVSEFAMHVLEPEQYRRPLT